MHDDDVLLSSKDVSELTGLAIRTLEGLRVKGGGPVYVRLSPRAIRYKRGDVRTWINERLRTSTSDKGCAQHG